MEIHTKNNLTCGFKPNPALFSPHKKRSSFLPYL